MLNSYKKQGRIASVDLLKLFASILVVVSHCMMKYIINGSSNPVYNFIWLTQMPLFMFLSGFVNVRKEKISTFKLYLTKELKNCLVLLIPCFSFMLLSCLFRQQSLISSLISFYTNPETNLWFLWVLFVIHVFFDFGLYLSNKISFKFNYLIPVLISAIISGSIIVLIFLFGKEYDFSHLSLKLIAFYFPFYCLGYLSCLFLRWAHLESKASIIVVICVFVSCLAILLFICFYFESVYAFSDTDLKYLLIRVVGSVSAIFVCTFIADYAVRLSPFLKIAKFGSFSLQTYYLHIVFMGIIVFSTSDVAIIQWIQAFSFSALFIVLVIITMVVIYFIPYVHLILFGRSFSYYRFEEKLPPILR